MKTVVFDFDGVIHSYTSGWQGETVIPDPPVPGIRDEIERIRSDGYAVVVVSSRCTTINGMRAVREYLERNYIKVDDVMTEKPPAVVYIDDRAICFDGNAAGLLEKIENFQPWTVQSRHDEKRKFTDEQRCAYEWAKSQKYQSIAARYARTLAGLVDDLMRENES